MKTNKINLQPLDKNFTVNNNTPLIDVLSGFGLEFPCGGKSTCGKCKIRLLEGQIETDKAHSDKLKKLNLDAEWRLACLSNCTEDITLEIDQFDHLILADESDFEFTPAKGFGIAIDLGTSTIVIQLLDLFTAKVLAAETMLNPQVKFGADIISRIQAYMNGNNIEMTRIVREIIGSAIKSMCLNHNVSPEKIIISGNTLMQLIFSGSDVSGLSAYPFLTDNLGIKSFTGFDLNWNINQSCLVKFMPSIGSFVGSDILAGIAATKIHKSEKYTALIDLGTNGEIVLGNKNRIVCASTAAGPAFEGANISIGMRAVTGAISSVQNLNGKAEVKVIGNTKAKGICGSGLIDAIAYFRENELIGHYGEIISGKNELEITDDIKLSQKDISEFQLAKSAIATGIEILAKQLEIELSEIDKIYIAGGFGNYINPKNLIKTGTVSFPEERIFKRGNTSLIGTKIFLFENDDIIFDVLGKTKNINLESDSSFQELFINNLIFY